MKCEFCENGPSQGPKHVTLLKRHVRPKYMNITELNIVTFLQIKRQHFFVIICSILTDPNYEN